MKILSALLFVFCISKNCLSQTDNRILNADEMTKTSLKAMTLIKTNDFRGFKSLFVEEVSKQEVQLFGIFNFIKTIITKEGIPGEENIQVRLTKKLSGVDTIYLNVIAFLYKNPNDNINPFDKEISFSFLVTYGTATIAAVNYTSNSLSAQGIPIKINKLDSFILK
jgi:hypothetical protein